MSHAIRFHRTGGPEVLQWEAVVLPPPAAGEVRLRHHAVGLNFIDTYHRSGLYPLALPSGLGMEAAGVVEAVGEGVTEVKAGDRVAYTNGPLDAYSEQRNIPARFLVPLPDDISFEQGAAMMLQGITAHYLLHSTYPVKAGETILVHAAAGGVGSILVQWAKLLGATVIGTVGNDDKAARALALGCDHVIVYARERFPERVRELTAGRGVAVVYDSVGRDTFLDSVSCLQRRGTMVSYGNATGPVAPFDCALLHKSGSVFVTRPGLPDYIATREELLERAAALFEVVRGGKVRIEIMQRFALKDAAQAHRELEGRRTTGSTVLLP
ncbi:quinone oxidoreductase family protein [Thauera mechernichensis]|uniref:Quinone oxidoreductase family protein n=1 Tax=Thauera mechernichensis TaxID=82788 RepID=A0ABW3WH17_9RHOO|nr:MULTISPECIES: quinone oxidoreductase [Thauera]ENO81196.1 alcohol dehydrogenase zinc-binding domain-containing protein [Thauera sp. 27]ENO91432.1 alcohol dehydrogenase zinc-binding domain-containing protein [Thauera sp. 28]MDG3066430.1 quinone oxidoreductase [Thauera mechernichensis]HAG76392.1 quinone oxidoreductase [Thauera sp.]HNR61914.1 quinone oxidoreductase [Thauera sp.]